MQGNHPKNKSQSPLQCHPASLTHAVLHPSPPCCSLTCCFPFKLPRASQGPSCCVHTALWLLSLRTEGPATPQKTATLTIVFNAHLRLRIFFSKHWLPRGIYWLCCLTTSRLRKFSQRQEFSFDPAVSRPTESKAGIQQEFPQSFFPSKNNMISVFIACQRTITKKEIYRLLSKNQVCKEPVNSWGLLRNPSQSFLVPLIPF